jgi:hypothetical protein
MISTSPSPSRSNPWLRLVKARFFWLLVALLTVIFLAPALPNDTGGEWRILLMAIVILIAGTYAAQGLARLWVIILLSLGLILLTIFNVYLGTPFYLLGPYLAVLFVTLVYTATCILSFVLRGAKIGIDHILGAIVAYILIAMAFATLYLLVERFFPGSFSGGPYAKREDRAWWKLFYFSFSILSTQGFGDITPLTLRARSIIMLEQLVAVFYIAVLISRLTVLYRPSVDEVREKKHE